MAEPTKEQSDAMLNAVAAFLKAAGWNVAVIGDARIQKPHDGREFNYEFVVKFTGGKPKDKADGEKAGVQ